MKVTFLFLVVYILIFKLLSSIILPLLSTEGFRHLSRLGVMANAKSAHICVNTSLNNWTRFESVYR